MSSANLSSRTRQVLGASIAQETGGNVVVGPFAHDVIVYRMGALIEVTLTANPVAVTTVPDVGSFSLPVGAAAGDVHMKPVVKNPAADGFEVIPGGFKSDPAPEQFRLAANSVLTITGAAAAGSAGDYRLVAEVVDLPIQKGDANFVAAV